MTQKIVKIYLQIPNKSTIWYINIPDNTKNVVESEKTIKYGIFVKLFIEILKLIQKIFKKGDDK